VRAYPWRDTVIYDYPDGSEDVYQGGTAAWRFNNPGNIENGKYAASHGAIGGNVFAAFPDQKTGAAAQIALLQDRYQHLTLDDAIAKYAPPNKNPTAKYQVSCAVVWGFRAQRRWPALQQPKCKQLRTRRTYSKVLKRERSNIYRLGDDSGNRHTFGGRSVHCDLWDDDGFFVCLPGDGDLPGIHKDLF
jgi:hypothetical protein